MLRALDVRMPRYKVQRLRTGGRGKPRWLDAEHAYDCYTAFKKMLDTKPTTTEQLRVMDCKLQLEVLWPSHDMRCTPTYVYPTPRTGVWKDLMLCADTLDAARMGRAVTGRFLGRVDSVRFVQSPRHG